MIGLALVLACGGHKKHIKEGDDWMARDNPGAAARAYSKAIDAKDLPELHLMLADALVADHAFEASLEHSAVALEAEIDGARINRAVALLALGRADEAMELLKHVAVGNDDPEIQRMLGEAEIGRGDLTAAAHWLRESARTSDAPRTLAAQAYVAARLGDTETVGTLMPLARAWDEPPPEACADLGAAWLAAGQAGGATAAAELVLAVAPDARQTGGLRDVWAEDARRSARGQDWEGALRSGLRVLALTPDDGELSWGVATWYASLGEWPQAVQWAETALTLEPYRAPEQAGGSGVSAASASAAMTVEERADARRQIGALLAQGYRTTGDTAGELRAHELLMSTGQDDVATLDRATELLLELRRPLEATRLAMESHRRGSDDAARLAAIAFRDLGDLENAVGWASEAWSSHVGDPDIALVLAEMHAADMRYDEAMQVLQMAIGMNPDNRALEQARRAIVERAN